MTPADRTKGLPTLEQLRKEGRAPRSFNYARWSEADERLSPPVAWFLGLNGEPLFVRALPGRPAVAAHRPAPVAHRPAPPRPASPTKEPMSKNASVTMTLTPDEAAAIRQVRAKSAAPSASAKRADPALVASIGAICSAEKHALGRELTDAENLRCVEVAIARVNGLSDPCLLPSNPALVAMHRTMGGGPKESPVRRDGHGMVWGALSHDEARELSKKTAR